MVPGGYDPVTLNHWLWFKYQCHESSPADFQRLFENVMKRVRPEFMQIRPYGNIGDRKCDGLFHVDGMVFQVYSPDELKQAELQAKIEEDFDGAVAHWRDGLKSWVFVYNARRGLPPDITATLDKQKAKYPAVAIDHISSDKLWEMARGLTLQQRSEILGAPNGYEHLFFTPESNRKEIEEALEGRFVLVQDLMSPVNLRDVGTAMEPRRPFGAPLWVRPTVGDLPWTAAAAEQADIVDDAIRRGRDLLPRFSVFSFAQIPLALHLGFILSDRVEVECYQFDRERKTWQWPGDGADADLDIRVKGVPSKKVNKPGDVVIRVSISATIAPVDTRAVVTGAVEIDMSVKNPCVMWLCSPAQLGVLGTRFRAVLQAIRDHMPGCQGIHLFYAGPTGGAVTIGQQINPRMNPPVEAYEYSRQWNPRYHHALTLQEARVVGCQGELADSSRARLASTVHSGPERAGAVARPGGKGQPTTVIQFVAGDRGGGPRSQVQVPREEKGIRDAVVLGRHRDSFEFAHPVLAASLDDLIACHRARPAIVHLVGHGEERRMVLVRDRDALVEMLLLEPGQVETLFAAFPSKVRLVVFNTCRSLELARHITARGVVDLAIGVEGLIPDDHAVRFAVTFYRQLSEGLSVQAAFALAGLQLGELAGSSRPQLFAAEGVKPDLVTFGGN
jgi:SMODS-associated and fused to various effectors sensor domain